VKVFLETPFFRPEIGAKWPNFNKTEQWEPSFPIPDFQIIGGMQPNYCRICMHHPPRIGTHEAE